MLFCNEDRHLNNIAVLRRGKAFDYCPIFDFGAGLLSNVRDLPMDIDPKAFLTKLKALPLNAAFARQVHAAEKIFGTQLECSFTSADIEAALTKPLEFYARRDASYIRDRVETCITVQRKKLTLT
jgi:hypothetical protein